MENEPHAARAGVRTSVILANPNYLHASVLLTQLAAAGVRRVVISPGARSTPLALTAVAMETFACYTLIDERSAAFFALGLSKADGVPAALICTSGTAAANYFPAIIEAAQAGVPLIALTADRPLRLRNTGAPQTIDQLHLYGRYAKLFADLPEPAADVRTLRAVRETVAQAFAAAIAEPRGPVQLNVPLDEPLVPVPEQEAECRDAWQQLAADGPMQTAPQRAGLPPEEQLAALAQRVDYALCGLIVAGPDAARTEAEADAIFDLGKQLGWPILADVASGLRFRRWPVMPFYDIFLRGELYTSLAPDVVLSFGAFPTSRTLNHYLERHRTAYTARIQPHALPQDPARLAAELVTSDVAAVCRELARRVRAARDSLLWDAFQRAANAVRVALEDPARGKACEAAYVLHALRALPDGANLVLANSLSIRYADVFAAAEGKAAQVYAMRGANGIDGTLSHAAGIAAASGKVTLLITGDLAYFHDLTGLMAAARFAPTLRILLLNNNGGGIFHFLNVRENERYFETIHGTPLDMQLAAAPMLFRGGMRMVKLSDPGDITAALEQDTGALVVMEAETAREANYRHYIEWISQLSEEAARA